jgi:hypothetical protein
MPGFMPGIHVFYEIIPEQTWMAGTSPAMTDFPERIVAHFFVISPMCNFASGNP